MKAKLIKKIALISTAVIVVAIATILIIKFVNKDKDNGTYFDNENDALVFSTLEVDKVFSPFFSTSATDSNVVGLTQIGMLGNDKDGNVVYGDNEGVVTKDLEIRSNDGTANVDLTTTYYFVLKNDVRFSNGSYLTIKDVLFNLYVYLDPVYSGSSTIYSTDIIGLKEYRTQQADEKSQDRFMEQFEIEAVSRIDYLLTAADYIYEEFEEEFENETLSLQVFREYLTDYSEDDGFENIVNDFDKVCELFKEELNTDYDNSKDGQYKTVTFKDKNGATYYNALTTDVEMFLYNEGYLYWNKNEARLESSLTNNVLELRNWSREEAINTIYQDKLPMALGEVALYWNTSVKLYDYLVNVALEEYHATHERTYTNIEGIKFANQKSSVTVNGKTYAQPTYNADGSVSNGTNEVLSI